MHWVILAGEYPPQSGGVADYTQAVARGLVAAGDEVQVWAPPISGKEIADAGIKIHRLPDHFGFRSLAKLSRVLESSPKETQLLVQYVPHALGWKAMNLPFCLWFWRQRRRNEATIMFHEVAYPWVTRGRFFRHNFLALTNRVMAFVAARSAQRIFVSVPVWKKLLRLGAGSRPIEWLPVPANLPTEVSAERVGEIRMRLVQDSTEFLVGHFGTYGVHFSNALREVVPRLVADGSQIRVLLMGRGSAEFALQFQRENPSSAGRVVAMGAMEAAALAEHLAACDVLVQPYVDGISGRRGTVMAGMALGMPIVTTKGPSSEVIWEQSGAVCLVDSVDEMSAKVVGLLEDRAERARLGSAARALYNDRFHLNRTIEALRSSESRTSNAS